MLAHAIAKAQAPRFRSIQLRVVASRAGAFRRFAPPLLALVVLSGCMAGVRPRTSYEADDALPFVGEGGALMVYQDSAGPLSYASVTGRDVQQAAPLQRVKGRACQHAVRIPVIAPATAMSNLPASLAVSVADGTYAEAVADARRGLPQDALLFDVRSDLNILMVLGIYERRCVLIDAAVARPVAVVAAKAVPAEPVPGAADAPSPDAQPVEGEPVQAATAAEPAQAEPEPAQTEPAEAEPAPSQAPQP